MTSPQTHYFWSSLPIYIVVGLIGFILGMLLGWLLWRHCRSAVTKIDRENRKLREEYKSLSNIVYEN